MKSIFIALLVSERHGRFMRDYLEMVKNFTYPDLSLSIVENTPDGGRYFRKLKSLCSGYDFVKDIMRYDWNPKETLCFEMTSECKNMLREKFLDSNRDLYFSLDADTTIPYNSIEYLVEDDKDNVGFPTPMWRHQPCVFRQGGGVKKLRIGINADGTYQVTDNGEIFSENEWGIDLYTWYELIAMMRETGRYVHKVYAVGNGCLLSKRKVIEEIKWAVPKNFMIGEDMIWYENVYNKGFEAWVDMRTIPIHRFVGWESVPTWLRSKNQKVFTIFGPDSDEKLTVDKLKEGVRNAIKESRIRT